MYLPEDENNGWILECRANAKKSIDAKYVLPPGLSKEELRAYFEEVIWAPYFADRKMNSKKEFAWEITQILYEQGRLPNREVFTKYFEAMRNQKTWRSTGDLTTSSGEVIAEHRYCPLPENFLRRQAWVNWLADMERAQLVEDELKAKEQERKNQEAYAELQSYLRGVEQRVFLEQNEARVTAMAEKLASYFSMSVKTFTHSLARLSKTYSLDQLEREVDRLLEEKYTHRSYNFLNTLEKSASGQNATVGVVNKPSSSSLNIPWQDLTLDDMFDMLRWAKLLGQPYVEHFCRLLGPEVAAPQDICQQMVPYLVRFRAERKDLMTIKDFVVGTQNVAPQALEKVIQTLFQDPRRTLDRDSRYLMQDVQEKLKALDPN